MIWTKAREWWGFEFTTNMPLCVRQVGFQTVKLLLDTLFPSPYIDQLVMHLPQDSLNVIHEICSIIVIILLGLIDLIQGTTQLSNNTSTIFQ